jgi:putative peptidoglycan lipid II flippase
MVAAHWLDQVIVNWIVWVIPAAGVAQMAITWTAAKQAGFDLRPALPRFNSDMRILLITAIPAALATGVMQINLVVGQLVASRYEGAVSWLFAADRLYQLPLGAVGIAVGIVLLPDLSRKLESRDDDGARAALSRSSEFSMVLTIPSAVALCIIPLPLVSVLFGRGETGADDVAAIAVATSIYGLGLPAFVMQKVLQPVFFARGDTRRPFHYALATMVLNAAIAFGLAPSLGWMAPAIAATASGWAMLALLAFGTRPLGSVARFDDRLRRRLPRICVAAALMGGALFLLQTVLGPLLETDYVRYPALIVLILGGAASFFLAGGLIGAVSLGEFRAALRRR